MSECELLTVILEMVWDSRRYVQHVRYLKILHDYLVGSVILIAKIKSAGQYLTWIVVSNSAFNNDQGSLLEWIEVTRLELAEERIVLL